jgi:hypothetical protein
MVYNMYDLEGKGRGFTFKAYKKVEYFSLLLLLRKDDRPSPPPPKRHYYL